MDRITIPAFELWLRKVEVKDPRFPVVTIGDFYTHITGKRWIAKKLIHPCCCLKHFRDWFYKEWKTFYLKYLNSSRVYKEYGITSASGRRGLDGVFYISIDKSVSFYSGKKKVEDDG